MILDTTSKLIEFVLSSAVTTSQLNCFASYVDITTSSFTPGSNDTQTNDTSAVTIIAAPGASTQRQVKAISIYNADTVNATVTVRLNRSGTMTPLVKVTLGTGQTLQFSGENAWTTLDNRGNVLQATQVIAAGADKQVQFNDGGSSLSGDSDFIWNKTTNALTLSGSTPNIQLQAFSGTPATPAAGYTEIFGRTIAGRTLPATVDPTGLMTSLQPSLARNKIGYWAPPGNATTVPGVFGITAPTVVGTATARNIATTNLATRMRRLGYVSASTAAALTEARIAVAQFTCGSGVSGDGSGFFYVVRWVPSDAATVSGERNFHGITSNTAAATNVEPNTLTNSIGVAQLSSDATQLYLVYGGSTAQTAIALGSTNFPGATISTTAYELAIFAPNTVASTYYYQVTNITNGQTSTGTLSGTSVQVPQSTTLLTHKSFATNNATALAVGFDLCSIYFETDN